MVKLAMLERLLKSLLPDTAYGKRGAGNLTVPHRYGPGKSRRLLRCRTCKARFSERKGTPLFDARLPSEKVESVLEHVAEGCGVRQTGRLCRVAEGVEEGGQDQRGLLGR